MRHPGIENRTRDTGVNTHGQRTLQKYAFCRVVTSVLSKHAVTVQNDEFFKVSFDSSPSRSLNVIKSLNVKDFAKKLDA